MKNLRRILSEQEYDTDAIKQDCKRSSNSNILNFVNCNTKSFKIRDFIYGVELQQYTISPGEFFGFFYELKSKYETLKQEILNNNVHNLAPYQFHILLHKATKYIHSAKAKKMVCSLFDNEPITISHLLSICLYCCCTDLCTAFSETFRKNKWNETLESVKQRNMEFGHMSRLLMGCIDAYGSYYRQGNQGPFYCGMSYQMVLNQFEIRLHGPTSTSKSITVAQRFGTINGIVIQFDNTDRCIRSFGTSWISDYGTENEFLFGQDGGANWLRIGTVIIQRTSQNFKDLFAALLSLHSLLKGRPIDNIELKHIDIWMNLIEYKLGMTDTKSYPTYIYDTFHAFTIQMWKISLDLDHLMNKDILQNTFLKFLLVSTDDNISNVMSRRMLRLFPYIKYIWIYADRKEFCLLSLLKEIEQYPFGSVEKQLETRIVGYDTWVNNKLTEGIQRQYMQKGWLIGPGICNDIKISRLIDA